MKGVDRSTAFVRVALALTLTIVTACSRSKAPPLVAKTDVERIAGFVNLPATNIRGAHWLVTVDPNQSALPPAQLRLYAYIEIEPSAWLSMDSNFGPCVAPTELPLPTDVASALFGAGVSALPGDADTRNVNGIECAARGMGRPGRAVRFKDALVIDARWWSS